RPQREVDHETESGHDGNAESDRVEYDETDRAIVHAQQRNEQIAREYREEDDSRDRSQDGNVEHVDTENDSKQLVADDREDRNRLGPRQSSIGERRLARSHRPRQRRMMVIGIHLLVDLMPSPRIINTSLAVDTTLENSCRAGMSSLIVARHVRP